MKQQVFFIHGGEAYTKYEDFLYDLKNAPLHSTSNTDGVVRWNKKLRARLGDAFEVFTPNMPNSENAKYEEWKIWFERHFEFLHDDVILVGWSQGGLFLAKYLSKNNFPKNIKGVLLVGAMFPTNESINESREDGGDFIFNPELLVRIADQVDEIHILHSTDDFVVPYKYAEKYKGALPEATLHTFKNKNHFLVEELTELTDLIKEIAGK